MQQAIGTVGTIHHYAANLTDEQAARLEGKAREFYRRALELVNSTGCSVQMAIQAIQDAEKQQ
jgi:hypothetical protein